MTQELWTAVDSYFADLLVPSEPVFEAALQASTEAGLPNIQVAPNQGKLLEILARLVGARSILEIGTLGGYSTMWLARALPADGRLITLELQPKHAEVARANLARAGFDKQVEVRVGSALETLPQLAAEKRGPFDLVFIDADKTSTAAYFDWALKLTRRGSLIIVDNVVRNGAVANPDSQDANVEGIQKFAEALSTERRVLDTAFQTVGSKGYDGFALALVIGD